MFLTNFPARGWLSYENMREVSLRIRKAAQDLGVKRIVFGECGGRAR